MGRGAWRLAGAATALGLAAATAACAFFHLFSTFRFYDDDGLLLLSVRFMLEGRRLYDEVATQFGPFYFLYEYVLHALLGIPLTHDATRWVTLAHWIVTALLGAAIVRRITDSFAWAFAAYVAVFLSLRALANEPGHPQELCAVLAIALPLLVWDDTWTVRPGRLLALGMVAGLAGMAKINVGIFCVAAAATLLVADSPDTRWRRAVMAAVLATGALAPLTLMRTSLTNPGCAVYAAIASLSITATTLAAFASPPTGRETRRAPLWAAAGLGLGTALALVFVLARGSTVPGVVESIASFVRAHVYTSMCPPYRPWKLLLAMIAFGGAVLAVRRGPQSPGVARGIALGKAALLAVLVLDVVRPRNEQLALLDVAPWTWLWALAPERAPLDQRRGAVRGFVAILATWQMLLPYPVAGTQLALGRFLMVAVGGIVCAADLVGWLAPRLRVGTDARRRLAVAAPLGVLGMLCAAMLVDLRNWRSTYLRNPSLGLAGAVRLRLPEREARLYRQLVATADSADVFFTTSGMNSLYIWTGQDPPVPVLVTHDQGFLSSSDQTAILTRLLTSPDSVVFATVNPFGPPDPAAVLTRGLATHFEQVGVIEGVVRVLRPKPAQH